jgi:putative transposase
VTHRCRPWRDAKAVKFATLEWVNWFTRRRRLQPIRNIPSAEVEERYDAMLDDVSVAA